MWEFYIILPLLEIVHSSRSWIYHSDTHWRLPCRIQKRFSQESVVVAKPSHTQTVNSILEETLWEFTISNRMRIGIYTILHYFIQQSSPILQNKPAGEKGCFGFMFLIPGVILFLPYIALSQEASWIIASAEFVRGAITAERKFHQKQMKLLFSGL